MLVSQVTERVEKYLKDHKVNLLDLSKKTGITYTQLYNSVGNKKRLRELRADEFLSICKALEVRAETFIE